ncbi:MAG: hypothetical protein K2P84_03845 [Undibacterium sp.]|nr:hypothetical protein [Undibacterium sp.]
MNARKIFLLCALALVTWLAFFSDTPSRDGIVEVATRQRLKTNKGSDGNEKKTFDNNHPIKSAQVNIDLIVPRERLIGSDVSTAKKNKLIDLFVVQSWTSPPPVVKPPPVQVAPTLTPMAPPLPFQFIGKKFEDGIYEVYLASGDKTYVVSVNTVIDNLYHVDAIKPPTLTMTYLPLKQAQTMMIGASE